MTQPYLLEAGALRINLARREVYKDGEPLNLCREEFDLLAELVRNEGDVIPQEILLTKIRGYDYHRDTQAVEQHIDWLRHKIEAPAGPRIVSVGDVGYRLEG